MLPTELVLLPTGPGEETRLHRGGIGQYREARWLPDGTHVVQPQPPAPFVCQPAPISAGRNGGFEGESSSPLHLTSRYTYI